LAIPKKTSFVLVVAFVVFVADTVGPFGFQRMTPKLRILAMGDSTTAGTPGWRSPLEAPPNGAGDETSQYSYWLMKAHPDWEVLNRGVNGERSDQILARFERDVIAEKPAAVVIIAGVNDVYQGRPADFVTANLQTMYDRVVAGTIVPYNTATPDQNARMHAVNDWIRRQADVDPNIDFADTRAAVAAPGSPDRLSESPDGLHPTAQGYRQMAEAVRRVLEVVVRGAGL
jgi:lysophospholipase L1-like esterase